MTPAAASPAPGPSRLAVRIGWGLSGLVVLFLLLDGALKLPPLPVVPETMGALGWPTDAGTARALGIVLVLIAMLYAWPTTAVLGAVLLTGYLGGAVATHARVGSPLLSHTFFGLYVGLIAWAGLWLREPRLRALLPFSRG